MMTVSKSNISAMASPAASAAIALPDSAEKSFFERPFVQNILPFATSLSVHAGALVLGLLTYTAYNMISKPTQLQVNPFASDFVPDAVLPHYVGDLDDQKLRPQQHDTPTEMTGSSFTTNSAARDHALQVGGTPSDAGMVFDPGPHSGFGGPGGNGLTNGHHAGPGGDGSELASWGYPQPGGDSTGQLFTPPGAHRIAYVCDASGSMINKMASLKMELQNAVTHLKPVQSFSIIFFQDTKLPEMLDRELVRATAMNVRHAGTFLEGVIATGTTDPLPGIEAAFRQNPELIYLLTDGDFRDNALVLARIRELNKAKKVRINTIAFVDSNDKDVEFIDLLKTIANENGGKYRHVSEDELGK